MGDLILRNGEKLLKLGPALAPYDTPPCTGSRWCGKGIKAKDGRRIRLEHVRVGAKLMTSAEAVVRFFATLSTGLDAAPPPPTPAARLRAAEAALREMQDLGA